MMCAQVSLLVWATLCSFFSRQWSASRRRLDPNLSVCYIVYEIQLWAIHFIYTSFVGIKKARKMVAIQKATCGLSAPGRLPVQRWTSIRRSGALQAVSRRMVPSGRVCASSGGEKGDESSKSLLENVLNGLTGEFCCW